MTAKSITKADFNKGLQGIRSAIKSLEIRFAEDIKETNIKLDNTRLELNAKIDNTRLELKEDAKRTNAKIENFRHEVKDDIRQIITHLNSSQDEQNRRLDSIDIRLEAIMEMLTTRKEIMNLIRELKNQGIKLEEAKILIYG